MSQIALTASRTIPSQPAAAPDTMLNGLAVCGLCLVLFAAYAMQFALGEQPCPLCTLQRVAFVLAMFGFMLNARFGARPAHYGAVLLAAGFGMVVSGRQVLLHVVPGTPHYGTSLFGLHLYTWSFLLFAAMVPGTAVLLGMLRTGEEPRPGSAPRWVRAACWLGLTVTLANAVTIFLQCGPGECSDGPLGWWIAGTNR